MLVALIAAPQGLTQNDATPETSSGTHTEGLSQEVLGMVADVGGTPVVEATVYFWEWERWSTTELSEADWASFENDDGDFSAIPGSVKPRYTLSDTLGRFLIHGASGDRWVLVVHHPAYEPIAQIIDRRRHQGVLRVTLTTITKISGIVQSETGAAIPQARVLSIAKPYRLLTSLYESAGMDREQTPRWPVSRWHAHLLKFLLAVEAKSDERGSFSVTTMLREGHWEVDIEVEAPGYIHERIGIQVTGLPNLVVTLRPGVTLRGALVLPDDMPLLPTSVKLHGRSLERQTPVVRVESTGNEGPSPIIRVTDDSEASGEFWRATMVVDDRRFSFEQIPVLANARLDITVLETGYQYSLFLDRVDGAGEPLTVTLPPAGIVRGRIVGADGAAARGVVYIVTTAAKLDQVERAFGNGGIRREFPDKSRLYFHAQYARVLDAQGVFTWPYLPFTHYTLCFADAGEGKPDPKLFSGDRTGAMLQGFIDGHSAPTLHEFSITEDQRQVDVLVQAPVRHRQVFDVIDETGRRVDHAWLYVVPDYFRDTLLGRSVGLLYLPQAAMVLSSVLGSSARTDDEGRGAWSLAPGSYFALVVDGRYPFCVLPSFPLSLESAQQPQVWKIPAGTGLWGRVTDPQGTPVVTDVTISTGNNLNYRSWRVKTDDQGFYFVSGLLEQSEAQVSVHETGFIRYSRTEITSTSESNRHDVHLQKGRTIRVRLAGDSCRSSRDDLTGVGISVNLQTLKPVRDASGQVLTPGACGFQMGDVTMNAWSWVSKETGVCEFEQQAPGPYNVKLKLPTGEIAHRWFLVPEDAAEDHEEIFDLHYRPPLVLTLRDGEGRPIANADIVCSEAAVNHADWHLVPVRQASDTQGIARIEHLIHRPYQVTITAPGFQSVVLASVSAETTAMKVVLEPLP